MPISTPLTRSAALFATALLLDVFPTGGLCAQTPPPPRESEPAPPADVEAQSGEEAEEKAAFMRVWFMAKATDPVDVQFQNSKDGTPPSVLLSEPPPFYLVTGYRDLPAGSGILTVNSRGSQPRSLATASVALREAGLYTAIVRQEGSGYRIELIDDSVERRPPPDPNNLSLKPKPVRLPPKLKIYHFTEDLPVEVRVPVNNFSARLEFGGFSVLENPATLAFPIEILYPGPDGQPVTASTEADLKENASCSLVLVRDPYGRFSPRIVLNGRLD